MVTHLVSGRAGLHTQVCLTSEAMLSPHRILSLLHTSVNTMTAG